MSLVKIVALYIFRTLGNVIGLLLFFFIGMLITPGLRYFLDFDVLDFVRKQPEPQKVEIVVIEEKEVERIPPDTFFKNLTIGDLLQFDRLYEQRQNELRDVISSGSARTSYTAPKGLFAQMELIETQLEFLNTLEAYSQEQASVRQSFSSAYRHLRDTFEKEIEFLREYPKQSRNMSFVTGRLFEISSQDQKSGFHFYHTLQDYRRLLTETLREGKSAQENHARMQNIVALNTLINKYQKQLNLPD